MDHGVVVLTAALVLLQAGHASAATTTESYRQSYYSKCGLFDWDTCTRHRTAYRMVCASGWTGSVGAGCPTPICPGDCNNVGSCRNPDSCTCPVGRYPPRCYQCRAISNCDRESCSTDSDQICLECNGQYYPSGDARTCVKCTAISNCDLESCSTNSDQICLECNGQYELLGNAYYPSGDARTCVKQCSWRSHDACWPGSCSFQGVCTCSSGYSSVYGTRDCKKIDQYPTLSSHLAILHHGTTTVEAPSTLGTSTSYTNVRIDDIDTYEVYTVSTYQPILPYPGSPYPPYVQSAGIGIINVKATYVFKGRSITINCPNSGRQNYPRKDIVECHDSTSAATLSTLSVTSGDRLECKFEITNGGYLKLYNRDSASQRDIITNYYTGRATVMTETFTFDYDDPKHCVSGTEPCQPGPNMLTIIGEDVTTEPIVRIQWSDWIDTLAGIYQYHLEVRKMSIGSHASQLTELYSEDAIYNGYTQSETDVTLPSPGVYSLVLIPKDRAGNIKVARRIVLFDNVTQGPSINGDSPIIVTSASAETENTWITTHRGYIGIDWTHHFVNEAHDAGGFLREVGSHRDYTIENEYDDNFGRRNIDEIPYAEGVTEFRVHFDVDHNGGSSIVSPSVIDTRTWMNMTSMTTGSYRVPIIDGDSVRFWVYAEDRLIHGVTDSVLAHVDSSPAEIDYLWLARDGQVNLAVHNTAQLQDMRIQFRTFDVHSGLESIKWRITDYDSSEQLQEGIRPVIRNPDKCNADTCICIPDSSCYETDYEFSLPVLDMTNHDYDFLITVVVTNNAKLETTRTLKVTVDLSPPVAGSVHDGLRGSNERDFQADSGLNANWDGFFDKESGVMFYRYVFDTRCWDKDEFNNFNVANTSSTDVYWQAPATGTYYITVVAYNRALKPSLPVCSDGVTIDVTQPLISEVEIRNARITPGFAKDNDGVIWYIERDRARRAVANLTDICSVTVAKSMDIFIYPLSRKRPLDLSHLDGDCDGILNRGESVFLAVDQHIPVKWNGKDNESSIFNYNIGLSSDPISGVPDIVPFVSTYGRNEYVIHHPNIAQGSMFYIVLEAVNKAQVTMTEIIGPIIIDTTPPTFDGNIDVDLRPSSIEVQWDKNAFADDVDNMLTFELAIGHTPYVTDIMPFEDRNNFPAPCCSEEYSCATVLLEQLELALHTDHVFYVTVKSVNTVGLSVMQTSSPIRYFQQLPSTGVVFDVAPSTIDDTVTFGESPDIDVQLSNTAIAARWSGFAHPHLEILYEFGIGTSPELTDVSNGYIDVGANTQYEESNLFLTNLQTYYVSVRATAVTGSVVVTSDGITVLGSETKIAGVVVNDGLPCQNEDISSDIIDLGGIPCTASDIQFQAVTSVAESHWIIPKSIGSIVTNAYWSLEEQIFDAEQQLVDWAIVIDYKNIGYAMFHIEKGLYLRNGVMHRTTVKLCHFDVCFQPVSSNGFVVLSTTPITGTIDVDVVTGSNTEGQVTDVDIYFQPFQQIILPTGLDSIDVIDHYEWTVSDDVSNQAILMDWRAIVNPIVNTCINDKVHFRASLDKPFDYTRCTFINVRGYNKAGLSASVQKELVSCNSSQDIVNANIVLDASEHIDLEKNASWTEQDIQYSANASALFAVWPTLRYGNYDWAVIEESFDQNILEQLAAGLQIVCDHPMTVECGHTENEFINIHGLQLEHGRRYHVCIHASSTTRIFENWVQQPSEVSLCSDGVVIDMTPPTPGQVWIGTDIQKQYQRSTSDIVIHWDNFTDVEEHGQSSHQYGVKNYDYAIGSYPGGSDVCNFTNIGIADHVIITGLHLESGHVYYASVRATDFVGLSTVSYSDAVLVDASPPKIVKETPIDTGKAVWTSTTIVEAIWTDVFLDAESGVAFYEWSVGSQPGHADIMPFTRTESEQETSFPNSLTLQEGHAYFVTVKATNRAGLQNRCVIGPYLVDASPPIAGRVYDGNKALQDPNKKDQDFQTETKTLYASWEGFHDPHSRITGYRWEIGLCKGCDDVMVQHSIGIFEDASADHIQLVPGFRYYVTVTACNVADMCTSVTSDGIIVDDSPPAAGHVFDGTHGGDMEFSSSRYHIAAHWWGYHDVHSGILYYQWRAGTTPGGENIMQTENVHLQKMAFHFLTDPLPPNVIIYITVRAYNKAGLWNEVMSNGFIVDESTPEVITPVSRVESIGTIVPGTQVLSDVIQFTWLFVDQHSGIRQQYVSLRTHHNGDVKIDPFQINPSDTNYTFTSLELHDGALYTVHVTACNGAKRCTTSSSSEFMVDSSSPSAGAFAIDTYHAANLMRQCPDTMIWRVDTNTSTSYVDLAWLGFADCHSGIDHYFVAVGYSYDTHELTEADIPIIQHSDTGAAVDEGTVQVYSVPLNGIVEVGQRLYVSIWAVNGVGLKSGRLHSAFEITASGSLTEGPLILVRRCESHSCEGHCICAPGEQLCVDGNNNDCTDVTENNPNEEIVIYDVLDIRNSSLSSFENDDDKDYIPTQLVLSAKWRVAVVKGLPIVRYEWSIGLGGTAQREPEGVFDPATEAIWHDNAEDTSVVVPLQTDKKLIAGERYFFFIRAWYTDDTFAVYRSDGVVPYVKRPVILLGANVKDLTDASSDAHDIDFTTDSSMITIDWFQVFASNPEALSFFEVALGTFPGGEDIEQFADNFVESDEHQSTLSDLSLHNGVMYFGSVRAFTKSGLHTTAVSDGFRVDEIPPRGGTVNDGLGLHDLEYQNTTTVVAASWYGFVDMESYIHSYEWCVGNTMDPDEARVMPCINMGLHLSASRQISSNLTTGTRFFSKVFATDGAGLRSVGVVSNGFIPDTTPPIPQSIIGYGPNIITNPSFESVIGEPLDTFTGLTDDDIVDAHPLGWDVPSGSRCAVIKSDDLTTYDGDSVVAVYGQISQAFNTSIGKKYEITLFVSHLPFTRNALIHEGRIEAPGVKQVFLLYERPAIDKDDETGVMWQRHVFHFIADRDESELFISSLGQSGGILLDSVQVNEIQYETAVSNTTVDVHVQFIHGWSSVQATWCFVDSECPIMEYRWAIGHIPGGTQLQSFQSVGKSTTAQNTNLTLKHGASVYVTVTATNRAELTAVSYSDEVVVNMTAPVATDVFDGEHEGP